MNDDLFPVLGVVAALAHYLWFSRLHALYELQGNHCSSQKKDSPAPKQKHGKGLLRWGIIITALGIRPFTLDSTQSALPLARSTRFTSDPGCWEASSRFFLASA